MLLKETRWEVVYKDYYGNDMVLASFLFFSDAEKYITQNKLKIARLRLVEVEK